MTAEDQFQNPQGEEGRKVLEEMNAHHKDVTTWALAQLPRLRAKRILDIGCGGGAGLRMLAMTYPGAKVDGVDISADAVQYCREHDKALIEWGRLAVTQSGVSALPFPDGTFDLITSVETYFFWPDPAANVKQAAAKLKAGGIFCIVTEQYLDDAHRVTLTEQCKKYHMKLLENDVLKAYMEAAGLTATVITDPEHNWATFLGQKA